MTDAAAFDPSGIGLLQDPVPALRRLQDDDPVHWSGRYGAWLVTRYEDVRQGLNDARLSPMRAMPSPEAFDDGFRRVFADYRRLLDPWMVLRDPPDHTRLRGLANKAFTPRAIEALRPRIEGFVEALLAPLPADGEFDFVEAFAYPLPAAVIAELIGVPRGILDDLKRWSDDIASSVAGHGVDPYRRAAAAVAEMGGYLADFVEARRRRPGDGVIDGLIAARDGRDRLGADELVSNLILFLFAGHETTTNLLSNGLRTLLGNPAQLSLLRDGPGDVALVRNAVEEILRYDGAVFMSLRVAREAFAWHGRPVEAGQRVFLYHVAANRDARMFAEPDRFDIRRETAKRHLAFGYGIHFCLGAPLARLEMEVALPALLRRFPRLALREAVPRWKRNMVLRGQATLRLAVGAAADPE